MNCTWITNSNCLPKYLLLYFCCCLKRLPFPSLDEGPDIPITQMLLIAPLITTIILPLKRAIRISVQRSSWRWRSFISLLNLILCFQFVCSCHVTIRMQHKTIYKSWLKQILKNIRGFLSREKFSAQESSNFLPLCQTLFIFMIAQILFFVLAGTEWYWCCWHMW